MCKWEEKGKGGSQRDPDWWRCCNVERGQRCSNPGSLSHGTMGGGPWYCADHFGFSGGAGPKIPPPAGFFARAKARVAQRMQEQSRADD